MPRTRPPAVPFNGDPFHRVEQAADRAAQQVLEEDFLLRQYGIKPPSRSR